MANRFYNHESDSFNLSAIMKAAWDRVPTALHNRKLRFKLSLGLIWAQAKAEKENYGKTEKELVKQQIRNRIEMLSYKPWSVDIASERRDLEQQLAA